MQKQLPSKAQQQALLSSSNQKNSQIKDIPASGDNKNQGEKKQQKIKQSAQSDEGQFWQKIFQIGTEIGKLNLQVISFKTYKWIIITQSNSLVIDGSLQLAMKTPYSDKPTVLDIGADENQASNQQFCSKLSKELGCAIILSINLQVSPSIRDQRNIIKFLGTVLKPKSEQKEQQQQQKEEASNRSVFAKKQKPASQQAQIIQK